MVVTFGVMLAGWPSPAFADPPRPTDYRTEIVSVTPAVPGIEVAIIGGDAFIEIDAGGHEVTIPGYEGEPYLRFDGDGTVTENVVSPAHFFNLDRYSQTRLPPEADATAAPVWEVVDTDGRFAWHDHRTHWMQEEPPLGLGPGDQILDSVIPITVDGMPVEIAVVSVWMAPPSRGPWLLAGLFAAVVGVATVARCGRRQRVSVAVVGLAALAALGMGLWQTWSLPAETGPPIAHWALPAVALLVALSALVWARWSAFTVRSLALVAGVQLVVWTVLRIDVLSRAILPTDAPFWLDRVVTASAGVLAVVTVYASVLAITRLMLPASRAAA